MDSIKHSWNHNTPISIETFFMDFYETLLYGGLCLFAAFCEVSKVLLFLITMSKEVMFSPMYVCWMLCQQDYTTTAEQISTKLGWRPSLGPE